MRIGGRFLFPLGGAVLRGSVGIPQSVSKIYEAQILNATAVTFAGGTAETAFPNLPLPPAGAFNAVGTVVKIMAWGTFSSNATPTYTLRFRFDTVGGRIIGGPCLMTRLNAASNAWAMEGGFVTQTSGAAGTVLAMNALLHYYNGAGIAASDIGTTTGSVGPNDLFVAHSLALTAECTAIDGANVVSLQGLVATISSPLTAPTT